MPEHLILRLDGPLQAWGDIALDPQRPTLDFPTRSALAGLFANALGWRHKDGERINALQDALVYGVREDRPPERLLDYQTVDLEAIGTVAWTRQGLEKRTGGPHILWRYYLAGGCFTIALRLVGPAPVTLDELAVALQHPARPLFLGRKSCPPAGPLCLGRVDAVRVFDALLLVPLPPEIEPGPSRLRFWYPEGEGDGGLEELQVSDRRDYRTNRFTGRRRLIRDDREVAELGKEGLDRCLS